MKKDGKKRQKKKKKRDRDRKYIICVNHDGSYDLVDSGYEKGLARNVNSVEILCRSPKAFLQTDGTKL
jgi:hypothetical protein